MVRGVLKGESAATLARELGMSRTTITELRHLIQANAAHLQTETRLEDNVVEADARFQNAGGKGDEHCDPLDPPHCRANQRRGRGTYANDRPPVLGVIGRETGQVRLSSRLLSPMPWSTPTSIQVTTRSSEYGKRSVMAGVKGHAHIR